MALDNIRRWTVARKIWLGIQAELQHSPQLARVLELLPNSQLQAGSIDTNNAPDAVTVAERATGHRFEVATPEDWDRVKIQLGFPPLDPQARRRWRITQFNQELAKWWERAEQYLHDEYPSGGRELDFIKERIDAIHTQLDELEEEDRGAAANGD